MVRRIASCGRVSADVDRSETDLGGRSKSNEKSKQARSRSPEPVQSQPRSPSRSRDATSRLTSARAGAPSRRRTRQPRHHHVPGGTGRDCVAAYLAVRQRDGLEMDRAYRVSAKRRTTTRPGRQRITHPDPPFPAPTRMRKATGWRACAWMACRDAARVEGDEGCAWTRSRESSAGRDTLPGGTGVCSSRRGREPTVGDAAGRRLPEGRTAGASAAARDRTDRERADSRDARMRQNPR